MAMTMSVWVPEYETYVTLTNLDPEYSWRSPTYSVKLGEQVIGLVWKGTRTWSPPTHKGSRVAKFHKQVPCWYYEVPERGGGRFVDTRTRREAITRLIDAQQRST